MSTTPTYKVDFSPTDAEDWGHGWFIKDFEGCVVARLMSQHNAHLICRLLNRST